MNPHSFLEPHSRAIRIWHWTFVLFVSATIGTVLLASTIFRTRNTVPLVEQQLQLKGVSVSEDQARAVSVVGLSGSGNREISNSSIGCEKH
jgi:hypothetical protein